MDDLDEILGTLRQALDHADRQRRFTIVWVPIQVGMIVLAALARLGARGLSAPAHRPPRPASMGWPVYPARAPSARRIANLGIIVCIVLLLADADRRCRRRPCPSRSYLIGVAASLATAWVVIARRWRA